MSALDWLRRIIGTARDGDAADEERRARLPEAYSAGNRDRPALGGATAAARGFRRWAELSRLSIRRRLRGGGSGS